MSGLEGTFQPDSSILRILDDLSWRLAVLTLSAADMQGCSPRRRVERGSASPLLTPSIVWRQLLSGCLCGNMLSLALLAAWRGAVCVAAAKTIRVVKMASGGSLAVWVTRATMQLHSRPPLAQREWWLLLSPLGQLRDSTAGRCLPGGSSSWCFVLWCHTALQSAAACLEEVAAGVLSLTMSKFVVGCLGQWRSARC